MVWIPGKRPVAATVGINVRVRRHAMGLTLAEMARRMTDLGHAIDHRRLSTVERQGVNNDNRKRYEVRIDVDMLAALATVLECTPTELMTSNDPETGVTSSEVSVMSRGTVRSRYAVPVRRALCLRDGDTRGDDMVNRIVSEVIGTRDRELLLLRQRLALASNLQGLRL